MSDFRIELLVSEIRVVQDTADGEHFIEASAEQLMQGMTSLSSASDFTREVVRTFASMHGQGALQDLLLEAVDENMTESPARGLTNKLIGKYMR